MATNERRISASPEQVFGVLADGWLYPTWVVGASRMRSVDAAWPEPGSRLHHSAGVWPALIDDNTEVLEWVPGRMLRMRARGWPLGEAEVTIDLEPKEGGTLVELREQVVAGPGRFLPRPAQDVPLSVRNTETLRRLAYIAEGRAES